MFDDEKERKKREEEARAIIKQNAENLKLLYK